MPMFGPDPTIEALKSENAFLRQQVQQLQDKLLAIADKAAYRTLHPTVFQRDPSEKPRVPNLAFRRHVPFRPEESKQGSPPRLSNEEMHRAFRADEPTKAG